MNINPIVWKSIFGLVTATGAGHLLIITSAAVTSAVLNHFLRKRGYDMLANVINKLVWIGAGFVFMDIFFDAGRFVQSLFDLKGL